MLFCPKCGSVLVKKRKNFGCPRCGYTTQEKIKIEHTEKFGEKQRIEVIKDKDIDILPVIEEECPKCKNKKAYFWTSQTRSGDEAETKFFRCTKCGHTWREYK